ncbi:MAG TPA: stage II sporulation protein R [Clostridia bacterium]|jgi:stage II sporulation protein R|nr:stage II sporulation protein R [Clostridia bacterium]HOL61073.1 stage II sporulation protein R [Clostridia bacterium]
MMRKIAVIFLLIVFAAALAACTPSKSGYVRIHIRANSDSEADQQVKLEVRDQIVAYLTPLLKDCKSAKEAKEIIESRLDEIEEVANGVLAGSGYGARASLTNEYFPEKDYGNLTLEAGNYDALVVRLGSGEGANWWCVAFPPLCFVPSDGEGRVYKSKIMEIIEKNKDRWYD